MSRTSVDVDAGDTTVPAAALPDELQTPLPLTGAKAWSVVVV